MKKKCVSVVVLFLLAVPYTAHSADGKEDQERARRACIREARERGHKVQEVESVRRDGRDWTVVLDVGRERVRCHYDERSNRARIAGDRDDKNDSDLARRACINQARARGHRVQEVESVQREGGGDWTVVLDVGRERVRCRYDARRERARLP
jgi:hypothetical protein